MVQRWKVGKVYRGSRGIMKYFFIMRLTPQTSSQPSTFYQYLRNLALAGRMSWFWRFLGCFWVKTGVWWKVLSICLL